jgi:hypothetical protein
MPIFPVRFRRLAPVAAALAALVLVGGLPAGAQTLVRQDVSVSSPASRAGHVRPFSPTLGGSSPTLLTVSSSTATASQAGVRNVARAGGGNTAEARQVDVSALPSAPATTGPVQSRDVGALRIDGTNSPAPANNATSKLGPTTAFGPLVTTPSKVLQNFPGTLASQACGSCTPPDSNGAMNQSDVVEATNLALTTWKKTTSTTGTLVRRVSMNTFIGTSDSLSDPRVFWDNAYERFVLVITVVPASTSSTPAQWLAVSKTSNPDGSWWRYRFTFGGGQFKPGVLLDYPMVGMDAYSVIISNNNFQMHTIGKPTYSGTEVYAVAKKTIYHGLHVGFPGFVVGLSAHPAFVEGSRRIRTRRSTSSPLSLVAARDSTSTT